MKRFILLIALVLGMAGCVSAPDPTPTPTVTPTATDMPTPTNTPEPTETADPCQADQVKRWIFAIQAIHDEMGSDKIQLFINQDYQNALSGFIDIKAIFEKFANETPECMDNLVDLNIKYAEEMIAAIEDAIDYPGSVSVNTHLETANNYLQSVIDEIEMLTD